MEFNCKKCEKKIEFLHLKNKDSRLFELCDDCFDIPPSVDLMEL